MSPTRDQQRFTVSEVEANGTAAQYIANANGQLGLRCS